MTGQTIPEIHIRQAAAVDRPRLVQLINSAFSIETFLEGTRTDEERLAAMMENGDLLVAEDAAGHPLGSVYLEQRGTRGYLGMLAVDPAHQREGLGRRLMEAAEDHFRRLCCTAVDITVLSLRPELPPLYRRFGYVETGEEEFHPSHPQKPGFACNCIVMSKQL
jgi:predicted N-acetyltransferase YhbS